LPNYCFGNSGNINFLILNSARATKKRLEKTELLTKSCEQAYHNIEIQNHKTAEQRIERTKELTTKSTRTADLINNENMNH
jgi:hypothetical protein